MRARLQAPPLTSSMQQARKLMLAGLGGLFALYAYYVVRIAFVAGLDGVILAGFCAASLAFLVLVVWLRRDYDVGEPISFIILAVAVGITFKAPYVLLNPESPAVTEYSLLGRDPMVLMEASVLCALGMMALVAGYFTKPPPVSLDRVRLIKRTEWSEKRLYFVVIVLAVISIVGMYIWMRKMGIVNLLANLSQKRFLYTEGGTHRSSLAYFRTAASLNQYAFFILLAWKAKQRKSMFSLTGLAIVILGILSVAVPIIASTRSQAATILLTAMLISYYIREGVRVRTVVSIAVMAIGLFTVMSALRSSREDNVDAVEEQVGAEMLLEATVGGRHFLDLTKTAHIIDAVPSVVEYKMGQTFFSWVVMPVPRSMWLTKPALGSGPELGPAIFGLRNAGVPPGVIAELYLNFGVWGVVPGMFVLGVLLKMAYLTFLPHRRNPNVILGYAVILLAISFQATTGDLPRVVVQMLTSLIPLSLALYVIGKPPATQPSVAQA